MDKRKPDYGEWESERRLELREKERRGEELSHAEKLDLALDEGSG